ncbi:transcriptional regulator [Vibrio sp. 10N.286.49.C2]|uniref:ChrR family anti-sigma-E factor n=1 Tax=unclassified Vibrio TaxID=2614977 RepID=UPI000C827808|nr:MULTISPECIES: ChrR family anti-sigma-E factor [unclassified Vibrio]PMH38899.1 transcriptional regulator [Vibrio sp. 10N.286.49.C2]PMH55374.1 transcriptional regulator [Vibrio sp. 10N.286.49.B1]PMH78882.1 transcriptional regulator [Vibrio sp. 10N.286.48.B7]
MAYHPDDTLLKLYAAGEIDTARGVAIASHVDSCHQCREAVARFEECAASALDDIEVLNTSHQDEEAVFSNMLEDIMTLEADFSSPKVRSAATITVNDKSFRVPASLQPLVDRMGEWRSYGGKVFTSTVDIDENYRVNLLYITEGVQVPQHTHKGIESTLVLHGEFSDEMGSYSKGDYLEEDGETKHAPQTAMGQDCLCLSILTEPMVFTQGVARIFNRFGKGMYP